MHALRRLGRAAEARMEQAIGSQPDSFFDQTRDPMSYTNGAVDFRFVDELRLRMLDSLTATAAESDEGGAMSVAAVGHENKSNHWRSNFAALGLSAEANAIPDGDVEGASELVADGD